MRDWRRINDNLVKRGGLFADLSFLDKWQEELAEMNRAKKTRGPKYAYASMLFYLG